MMRRFAPVTGRAVSRRLFASAANDEADTLKTALFDWHIENGGKMVPFAGYSLPVQYTGHGVLKGMRVLTASAPAMV